MQGSKIHFWDIFFFIEFPKMNQISRKLSSIADHPNYLGEFFFGLKCKFKMRSVLCRFLKEKKQASTAEFTDYYTRTHCHWQAQALAQDP